MRRRGLFRRAAAAAAFRRNFVKNSKEGIFLEAEIIAVGTELLLGDILNTNAQFLSRELAGLGLL